MPSPAEKFLADFHARHAGATSVALGGLPVRCEDASFDSSYDLLAAQVPATAVRVLDVACGDGFLLARLAARGRDLTGVDMSATELASAQARLGSGAALIQCRAQELPFAGASFDAVVSHMALMLMDDPPRVMDELRRVMAPGGRFAAVVGAPFPPSPALETYRGLIAPRIAASPDRVAIGDARWRTREGAEDLMRMSGFGNVATRRVEGEVRLPPQQLWDWFMLMYDAHFIDAAARDAVRAGFLDAMVDKADDAGLVHLPIGWLLILATA